MLLEFHFLVFLLVTSTVPGELTCFRSYSQYSGNCYAFYSSPVSNYNEALKICESDGADLASIHNAFENSYIASAGQRMLIGLRYNPERDIYQWSDDSVLDYTNYDDGFEAQREYLGYCAQIINGKWTNAECEDDKLDFVCKAKAVDIPETPTWACPDPNTIHEGTYGDLFSPGYPNAYNLNRTAYPSGCLYKLAARNGYRIRIHIQELSISGGYITVYNKLTDNSAYEVARIDGRYVGGQLFLESNVALLSLPSSSIGKWRISWSAEEQSSQRYACPDASFIYTESQTIYSPGYPENFEFSLDTMNTGCRYKLVAQNGLYIEIKLEEIFLEKEEGAVEVYSDWYAADQYKVVSFNGGNLGQTIKVPSSEVLLRVRNSHRGSYKITWRSFNSEICSSSWTYFNGSCYLQGSVKSAFDAAKSYCSNRNSHLVYIETAEENQFLADWLPPAGNTMFWLGLTHVGYLDWCWLNFDPVIYANWWAGEPDSCCGDAPFCGLLNYEVNQQGYWMDHTCKHPVPYPLCEREAATW